jgi:hypothetical protein
MTAGKVEAAERPLVSPNASLAMRRFWAEFRARTAAAHKPPRPAPHRESKGFFVCSPHKATTRE